MNHYETLGVSPTAEVSEVRRAYLGLARRHHPDAGGDPATMRQVNDAWHVLSDPVRRARYDRSLVAGADDDTEPDRPDEPWSDEDDLAADLADDRPITLATAAPNWLAIVPAATFVISVLAFGAGLLVGWRDLVAASYVLLVLAGASFVLMPFFALADARRRRR